MKKYKISIAILAVLSLVITVPGVTELLGGGLLAYSYIESEGGEAVEEPGEDEELVTEEESGELGTGNENDEDEEEASEEITALLDITPFSTWPDAGAAIPGTGITLGIQGPGNSSAWLSEWGATVENQAEFDTILQLANSSTGVIADYASGRTFVIEISNSFAGNVTVSNLNITKRIAIWGNGAVMQFPAGSFLTNNITVAASGNLTLANVHLMGSLPSGSTVNGVMVNGGTLAIYDGTIISGFNQASSAGVRVENGGQLTMGHADPNLNSAYIINGNGGVILLSGSSFTMYGGEITGHVEGGSRPNEIRGGAGVHVNDSTFVMYNGEISGNTARFTNHGGGGVAIARDGRFYMHDGNIINNTVGSDGAGNGVLTGKGGGVAVGSDFGPISGDAFFRMIGGNISNNTVYATGANPRGGGVSVTGNGTFVMDGGYIEHNRILGSATETARRGTGVGLNINATFTMNNGHIRHNTRGGVGVQGNARFIMNGGAIDDNGDIGVTLYGGSTPAAGPNFLMTDGFIRRNNSGVWVSAAFGGGDGVTFDMRGGEISDNHTTLGRGGGITNFGRTIIAGTVSGNTAPQGGGIWSRLGHLEIRPGALIDDNTATAAPSPNNNTQGGGGIRSYANLTMTGGTVSNNRSASNGGGIFITGQAGATAINGNWPADINITGGVISDNTANANGAATSQHSANGGGIFVGGHHNLYNILGMAINIIGVDIIDNTAMHGGGIGWPSAPNIFFANEIYLTRLSVSDTVNFYDNVATAGMRIDDNLNYRHNLNPIPARAGTRIRWASLSESARPNNTHVFNNYDVLSFEQPPNDISVTFDGNGDDDDTYETRLLLVGMRSPLPPGVTRQGHVLTGWFNGSTAFDITDPPTIMFSTTFTAQWDPISGGGQQPPGNGGGGEQPPENGGGDNNGGNENDDGDDSNEDDELPPGSGGGGSELAPGNGGSELAPDVDNGGPPTATVEGNELVPGENGTWIELDEAGVPLGIWTWDEEEEEWVFEELPVPLGALMPQTGIANNTRMLIALLGLSLSIVAAALLFIMHERQKKVKKQ